MFYCVLYLPIKFPISPCGLGGFGGFQVGSKSSGKPLLRQQRRYPQKTPPGPPKQNKTELFTSSYIPTLRKKDMYM